MKILFLSFLVGLLIFSTSCEGPEGKVGPNGLNSLIKTVSESSGSNCEFGGLKVESGLDYNFNGVLDPDEVTKTDYVCSLAGKNSLVNIIDELPGANCLNGGVKIESGIDDNQNGTLDSEEVEVTRFICNGTDGAFDKEIKFNLTRCACSYSPEVNIVETSLLEFDIRDYPGIDSAVFIVYDIATYNGAGYPKVFESTFELYDITNDVAIAGTSFTSDDITDGMYLSSTNAISGFPQERINLGIRVTDGPDVNTITGDAYLVLRRN